VELFSLTVAIISGTLHITSPLRFGDAKMAWQFFPQIDHEVSMKFYLSTVLLLMFLVVPALGQQPTQHAFMWSRESGMKDLGSLGASSYAEAVNASGQVAGYFVTSLGDLHAFRWTAKDGMKDLGTLGGNFSVAWGIDDSGVVVGSASRSSGGVDAVLWTAKGVIKGLRTLGGSSSEARAINKKGDIVGDSSTKGNIATHAFLKIGSGRMRDLGTLGGASSSAGAVNVYRVVAGNSITADGDDHAFLWTKTSGMQDLGTLGQISDALGINNLSQVVGYSVLTGGSPFHAFFGQRVGACKISGPWEIPAQTATLSESTNLTKSPAILTPTIRTPFTTRLCGEETVIKLVISERWVVRTVQAPRSMLPARSWVGRI
jgi:probable HAF family extracellular repeat protein